MLLCLSIKCPWINLILNGEKSIEIRTWKPAFKLPKIVLLHAGMKTDKEAEKEFEIVSDPKSVGCILGVAQLVEVRSYKDSKTWARDIDLHRNHIDWWHEKNVGFVFGNIWKFNKPIKYKGQLNFFKAILPEELEEIIKTHYELAAKEIEEEEEYLEEHTEGMNLDNDGGEDVQEEIE